MDKVKEVFTEQMYYIERNIEDMKTLSKEIDRCELDFDDETLSVSWYYGILQFRQDGYMQYSALKAIYKAGEEGITHSDLAELLYGDPLANIKNCMHALSNKLEKSRCPLNLKQDKTFVRLVGFAYPI